MLEDLLLIGYRYAKFALDPTTGTFSAVKCGQEIIGLSRFVANLCEQGLARPWLDRCRICEERIGRAVAAAKAHFVWT